MLECEFVQIDYNGVSCARDKRNLEHNEAYSLLDKMLRAHGVSEYEISRNENGKPYIDGSDIHFSISHTEGLCAVALSDTPIGIDCEKINSAYESKTDNFSKRYFLPSEQNEIEKSENRLLKFFEIWTRKEAYIKKHGLNSGEVAKVDTTSLKYETVWHGDYIITIFK